MPWCQLVAAGVSRCAQAVTHKAWVDQLVGLGAAKSGSTTVTLLSLDTAIQLITAKGGTPPQLHPLLQLKATNGGLVAARAGHIITSNQQQLPPPPPVEVVAAREGLGAEQASIPSVDLQPPQPLPAKPHNMAAPPLLPPPRDSARDMKARRGE